MNDDVNVLERKTKVRQRSKMNIANDKKYKVIFHNDDETSFEFVIMCLVEIFEKNINDAIVITGYIHNNGQGVVGIYSMEEAKEKVEKADALKAKYNMPLLITIDVE